MRVVSVFADLVSMGQTGVFYPTLCFLGKLEWVMPIDVSVTGLKSHITLALDFFCNGTCVDTAGIKEELE